MNTDAASAASAQYEAFGNYSVKPVKYEDRLKLAAQIHGRGAVTKRLRFR